MKKYLEWIKTGGFAVLGLIVLLCLLWFSSALIPRLIFIYEEYLYTPLAIVEFVAFYLAIILLLAGFSKWRKRVVVPLIYCSYILAGTLLLHSLVNTYHIWGFMGLLIGLGLLGIGIYFVGLAALFSTHQWFVLSTFVLDGLFVLFIRYMTERWILKEKTPTTPEEVDWGDRIIKSPKFGRALADHLYKIGQLKEKITDEDLEEIYHKKKEGW